MKEMTHSEASRTFRRATTCFVASTGSMNWKTGFQLLKRAAALNHMGAHEWLGAAYDYGLGTRRSRRRSFEHYLIAARAGNPNAEYHIGVFYLEGIIGRKDYSRGLEWMNKAAKDGDATALHVLGECYRYGQGVRKNPKKGFILELKAARKGVPEAQWDFVSVAEGAFDLIKSRL